MGKIRELCKKLRSDEELSDYEWRVLADIAEKELNERNAALDEARNTQYMFSIGFGKANQDVQSAKAALRKFGSCHDSCGSNKGKSCNCGYQAGI